MNNKDLQVAKYLLQKYPLDTTHAMSEETARQAKHELGKFLKEVGAYGFCDPGTPMDRFVSLPVDVREKILNLRYAVYMRLTDILLSR